MNWLDKLEKKLGRFAIPNLMTYIVGLNAIVFIMSYLYPENISKLMLNTNLVLKGEVWRLFTYIFIPPTFSPLWLVFVLYFYYMIGTALEHEWGTFRFNLFYLMGIIGTTIAAFLTKGYVSSSYINLSLFLAFARIFPDYEILLFFILPIKIKYLAWFNWAFFIFSIISYPISYKLSAIASLINYFIFFGKDITTRTKSQRKIYQNKRNFHSQIPKDFTIHKCTVCGITEKDDPNMEFRYCSTCEGDYEYCMKHLKNHKHIKKDEK
ncbi:rhomboid family intramembrane serine protease [Defluviitalea phaphyphila]|uniref:rhomboid family intramembrane serine protease n=1 Tax=Defluviitalea phaphyphila TaxID=1473580 RepID=UPI000731AD87|nr:rhomboid family intramembrane serine protease [Defluviitalea phaphyphila]